jgi:hypothetical protein
MGVQWDNIPATSRQASTASGKKYCTAFYLNLTEKTMYLFMACHRNAGKNRNIKRANKSFKNVAEFKYWGEE